MEIKNKNESGFSILEVIIALYIIIMGFASVLSLVSFNAQNASVGSSKLIAVNLAQEGIEIVKNIRDLNYTDSSWDAWYSSIGDHVFGTEYDYIAQFTDLSLRPFADIPLKYDSLNGFYHYDLGADSIFKRKITLSKLSDNEIKVVSLVTWIERGSSYSLKAEDHLWNWR